MAWSFEMQSHGFHTQVIEPTLRSITQMFKIEEVYVSHPNALKWDLSTFMKIDFELLFQLKPEFESFLTIISEKTILEVNDVI